MPSPCSARDNRSRGHSNFVDGQAERLCVSVRVRPLNALEGGRARDTLDSARTVNSTLSSLVSSLPHCSTTPPPGHCDIPQTSTSGCWPSSTTTGSLLQPGETCSQKPEGVPPLFPPVLFVQYGDTTVTVRSPDPKMAHLETTFQFDHVFDSWSLEKQNEGELPGCANRQAEHLHCNGEDSCRPAASQEEVYEAIGRPLLRHAFSGYNSCLFVYGQTGSGKTYTMMGEGDPQDPDDPEAGISRRLCKELFEELQTLNAVSEQSHWTVDVGYVEIYNERVSDLARTGFTPRTPRYEPFLEVREHPSTGVFLEGQVFWRAVAPDDVYRLLKQGSEFRHTAATKMNARSSRSHAILQLILREERIRASSDGVRIITQGKTSQLNLVDLAGSERVAQSQVEGVHFSEAKYINLSLTTLGRVIDALAEISKKGAKGIVPPYREAKLTFILRDSLGGNSKTNMVATVSPSALNYDETLSTLRYASRARDIVNTAHVNEGVQARRIRELEEALQAAKLQLQGADPAYVAELEERMRLMEADLQKRALDLQAMEQTREQAEIQKKLLLASEAEKSYFQKRSDELERRVRHTKEQADQQARQIQQLREDRDLRESELLESRREREAADKRIRQLQEAQNDGAAQLQKTMEDLTREREENAEAWERLRKQQRALELALSSSNQTQDEKEELQKANDDLKQRMADSEVESCRRAQLVEELHSIQEGRQHQALQSEVLALQLNEMESRLCIVDAQHKTMMELVAYWHDEAICGTQIAVNRAIVLAEADHNHDQRKLRQQMVWHEKEVSEMQTCYEAQLSALQTRLCLLEAGQTPRCGQGTLQPEPGEGVVSTVDGEKYPPKRLLAAGQSAGADMELLLESARRHYETQMADMHDRVHQSRAAVRVARCTAEDQRLTAMEVLRGMNEFFNRLVFLTTELQTLVGLALEEASEGALGGLCSQHEVPEGSATRKGHQPRSISELSEPCPPHPTALLSVGTRKLHHDSLNAAPGPLKANEVSHSKFVSAPMPMQIFLGCPPLSEESEVGAEFLAHLELSSPTSDDSPTSHGGIFSNLLYAALGDKGQEPKATCPERPPDTDATISDSGHSRSYRELVEMTFADLLDQLEAMLLTAHTKRECLRLIGSFVEDAG